MKRRRLLAFGLALVALAAVAVAILSPVGDPGVTPAPPARPEGSQAAPARTRHHIVDVHVHLSAKAVRRLEGLMKKWGFDHVVNLSGGHPLGNLPQQVAAAKSSGGRITVFASLAYEQAERPGYGARMARALEISKQMGARGLKIAKVLGIALKGPDGKLVPVDDPELDVVFETAGRLGMPVAIHSGDPKAFWLPVNKENERFDELSAHPGWALHGEDVPTFHEILDQLERRIARHPNTKFISVHFGNDAEEPERVARMLRKYPNMYIDTAARIPEMGRHNPIKMRAFFVEFQDRVLYGSDLGVGPGNAPLFLGSEGAEPATDEDEVRFFTATKRYFETGDKGFDHPTPIQGNWKIDGVNLPASVLEKIYSKNAMRVLDLDLPK